MIERKIHDALYDAEICAKLLLALPLTHPCQQTSTVISDDVTTTTSPMGGETTRLA